MEKMKKLAIAKLVNLLKYLAYNEYAHIESLFLSELTADAGQHTRTAWWSFMEETSLLCDFDVPEAAITNDTDLVLKHRKMHLEKYWAIIQDLRQGNISPAMDFFEELRKAIRDYNFPGFLHYPQIDVFGDGYTVTLGNDRIRTWPVAIYEIKMLLFLEENNIDTLIAQEEEKGDTQISKLFQTWSFRH